MNAMISKSALGSLVALIVLMVPRSPPLSAQVQQVVDLRVSGDSIPRILLEWGRRATFGFEPSFLGDVDGDGYDDVIIKHPTEAYVRDPDAVDPLSAISFSALIYGGPRTGFEGAVSLEELRHTRFLANPEFYVDQHAGVGDLDGDGFDDFLIASRRSPWEGARDAGQVIVVFGGPDCPGEVELSDLGAAGIRHLRLISTQQDQLAGKSISGAGDLNRDGKLDLAIAAKAEGSEDGELGAGRVYVLFGGFDTPRDIFLDDVGGEVPGFVIHGAFGGDALGKSISEVRDVNGDGLSDLVLCAFRARRRGELLGAAYVVFGRKEFPPHVYAADPGSFGVEIRGIPGRPLSAVVSVGDVDVDGLDDFLVRLDASGTAPNPVFLVFGSSGWEPVESLEGPGVRTVRFDSVTTAPFTRSVANAFGFAFSGIGDWNVDGSPDFFIGAPREFRDFGQNWGRGYLVLGGPHLAETERVLDSEIGTPSISARPRYRASWSSARRFGATSGAGSPVAATWTAMARRIFSCSPRLRIASSPRPRARCGSSSAASGWSRSSLSSRSIPRREVCSVSTR